ncbi:MAG: type II secretion system protein [Clostridiales bacterium]|nr:type II secretion system protein [Clostridiales bacterium]
MKSFNKGFTLIELVVSIAILGIIAVPLMGLFSVSFNNNMIAKRRTETVSIAESAMEIYKSDKGIGAVESKDVTPGQNGYTTVFYFYYNSHDGTNLIDCLKPDNAVRKINRYVDEDFAAVNSYADKKYNYAIKIVLDLKEHDEVVEINVMVWNRVDKDAGKVNFISLRSGS